ncbi:hypothetical protein [Ruegeria profundi]|uniref:hypothetical protein n=1 Tax=Ruegeria profundi TaxID=1685378 RepID=UPI003C7B3DC3
MNAETKATELDANADFFVTDFSDLNTLQKRVAAFCRWFDLPDPGLRYDEDGDILVDEVLLSWCKEEGISIDWLACGDPKGMAVAFRKSWRNEQQFAEDLKLLDDQQMRAIEIGMKAYISGFAPMEQTIEAAKKALKEVKEEAA